MAAARAAVAELRLGGAFTVIHVGGLRSAEDVRRSRATGAELRQCGTLKRVEMTGALDSSSTTRPPCHSHGPGRLLSSGAVAPGLSARAR